MKERRNGANFRRFCFGRKERRNAERNEGSKFPALLFWKEGRNEGGKEQRKEGMNKRTKEGTKE